MRPSRSRSGRAGPRINRARAVLLVHKDKDRDREPRDKAIAVPTIAPINVRAAAQLAVPAAIVDTVATGAKADAPAAPGASMAPRRTSSSRS
jgi:hypothetical protein